MFFRALSFLIAIMTLVCTTMLTSKTFSASSTSAPLPVQGATIIPSVELYSTQPAISIRRGASKTIFLSGAVYNTTFRGTITVSPNGSAACPIYSSGSSGFIVWNVGGITTPVTLYAPVGAPLGNNFNCGLKYEATHYLSNGGTASVGKGNQVDLPYTVKVTN